MLCVYRHERDIGTFECLRADRWKKECGGLQSLKCELTSLLKAYKKGLLPLWRCLNGNCHRIRPNKVI